MIGSTLDRLIVSGAAPRESGSPLQADVPTSTNTPAKSTSTELSATPNETDTKSSPQGVPYSLAVLERRFLRSSRP